MKNKIIALITLIFVIIIAPVSVSADLMPDTTAPTISVAFGDGVLHIDARDDLSGVESVYAGDLQILLQEDGTATVPFTDFTGSNSQIHIYAVDFAGNRSMVNIANPSYIAPELPEPIVIPEPEEPTELEIPQELEELLDGSDVIEAEIVDNSDVPENPLTPDGLGTIVDTATDADGKEFYTISTPAGNIFYLIIDKQRGTQNVYFLNAVTESDLLALVNDGADTELRDIPEPEPVLTLVPEPEPEPEPIPVSELPKESSNNTGTIIFIILAVAAAGGAGYYFKIIKPKQAGFDGTDDEYDDDDFGDMDNQPVPDFNESEDFDDEQYTDFSDE